jgi:hypothetical protein
VIQPTTDEAPLTTIEDRVITKVTPHVQQMHLSVDALEKIIIESEIRGAQWMLAAATRGKSRGWEEQDPVKVCEEGRLGNFDDWRKLDWTET